jgi:hypothetical protein
MFTVLYLSEKQDPDGKHPTWFGKGIGESLRNGVGLNE